jgi:hypothetical protein
MIWRIECFQTFRDDGDNTIPPSLQSFKDLVELFDTQSHIAQYLAQEWANNDLRAMIGNDYNAATGVPKGIMASFPPNPVKFSFFCDFA